jgi:hypothetical protein
MWRDAKVAYKSWWTQITVLLSAVAIFNFTARALDLELSELMAQLAAVYRALFHPIVELLTLPFRLSLTDWQKDLVLIWMALGGATVRTHINEMKSNTYMVGSGEHLIALRHWGKRLMDYILIPIIFLAWPFFWVEYFRRPFFAEHDSTAAHTVGTYFSRQAVVDLDHSHVVADMRVVLAVQVLTIVGVVSALLLVNWIGLQ